MISIVLNLAVLLPLSHIVYTDFKFRELHMVTWVVFVIISVLHVVLSGNWEFLFLDYILNLLIVALVMGISIWVVSKRQGSRRSEVIGMGDLIFFLPCVLWFETIHFVIWFNAVLILTVISHFLINRMMNVASTITVPLAGYFSVGLGLYILVKTIAVI